jgi:catecholate siderophore receptor
MHSLTRLHRLHGASPLALAVAAALGLAIPAAALADLGAEAGADASHRERRATELDKVEVVGSRDRYQEKTSRSATRTDTPLIDTPQSITVIPQAVIRDQAMQGVGDSLRYVPGVGLAQGEGNRDTPIFRGNSSTADMFVDGLRDDVQYFRDLYNIDRVEVLKGPNAMAFGRGGTGGLLNRVTKLADWQDHRDVSLQVGSWSRYRATADLGGAINDNAAWRLNALAEESDSFRDGVEASRRGINPVFAFHLGDDTHLDLGVEHFEDERTADRGVSSFANRPLEVDPSTFFGDPDRSTSDATVDAFTAVLEHDFGDSLSLRNSTRVARYDKFYQNVFPGAVAGGGATVSIQAYNNTTGRDNAFNQTDLVWNATTGGISHTVLAGVEFGRQVTDNFRETGYFQDTTGCPVSALTSAVVPVANPRYTGPLCFAQSATDADNHSVARTAAVYLQDQIELSPHWQLVLGLRQDRFEVDYRNNRNGQELESRDDLLSPRAGVVYKPRANVSLYANYSIAFLPRSGEQLASLSATTQSLEPERFRNVEVGFKWDIRPDLSFTAAAYRLSRSNVAVVDQANPTELVLLPGDSQRVDGIELGLSGHITEHWSVIGGAAWQDAQITQDIQTSSASSSLIPEGTLLPQVPRRSFSLWNRYDFNPRWGVGLGVVARDDVYASTSNTVRLPGYARVDAAVFWKPLDDLRVQLNVENLLDREYFPTAHSNTNISPGSPRAFTLGLHYGF